MNHFDYLLLGIVGISMALSLWRGFVREIISLIGIVAAFILASRTSGMTGDWLGQWIASNTIADMTGFALVFISVMIFVGLVGALIRKLVDMADLTATDRTLGIFFGMARGLFLIGLCFLVYTSYTKPDKPWMQTSILTPYAIDLGDLIGKTIPKEYPFSRRGGFSLPSPQQLINQVPKQDKEALKAIIREQMQ
ncbi:MAG: CvpA family protein [Mariprofundaceae bacterium]